MGTQSLRWIAVVAFAVALSACGPSGQQAAAPVHTHPPPLKPGQVLDPESLYAKRWPGRPALFRLNEELGFAVPPGHQPFWYDGAIDIVYPPAVFTSWLALEPSLAAIGAVVQGFSKGFALAGLRVGAVAMADPEALAALLAASDQPSTVDGVATLSQVAAAAACSPEGLAWLAAFLDHLRQRRDQTIDALRAIPGLSVSRPDATYVAFVGLPAGGEGAEALVERLRHEHGLALVPGSPRWFGPGGAAMCASALPPARGSWPRGCGASRRGWRQRSPSGVRPVEVSGAVLSAVLPAVFRCRVALACGFRPDPAAPFSAINSCC